MQIGNEKITSIYSQRKYFDSSDECYTHERLTSRFYNDQILSSMALVD